LHNAVPLCRGCNCKKQKKNPERFYDACKLREIDVLLQKARAAFEARFGAREAA